MISNEKNDAIKKPYLRDSTAQIQTFGGSLMYNFLNPRSEDKQTILSRQKGKSGWPGRSGQPAATAPPLAHPHHWEPRSHFPPSRSRPRAASRRGLCCRWCGCRELELKLIQTHAAKSLMQRDEVSALAARQARNVKG